MAGLINCGWAGRGGGGIGISLVNWSQYLLLLRKDSPTIGSSRTTGWEGLTSSHRDEPLHCLGDKGAPCGYRGSPGQAHTHYSAKENPL